MPDIIQIFSAATISNFCVFTILLLSKKWIFERLNQSIKYEYDEKLARIEGGIQSDLEQVKQDNANNADTIQSLRTGALENSTKKKFILYEKKVEALELIWKEVTKFENIIYQVNMVAILNEVYEWKKLDEPTRKSLSDFAKTITLNKSLEEQVPERLEHLRIYVSPLTWAYYSAYNSIILRVVSVLHAIAKELPPEVISQLNDVESLVKTINKHKIIIDEKGLKDSSGLFVSLQEIILSKIRVELKGHEDDQEAIDQASQILQHAEKVQENTLTPPK